MSEQNLVEIEQVTKRYTQPGGEPFEALKDISLAIASKEMTAIVGRSGSGKSTLLHLIGGLDRASSGSITVAGRSLNSFNEKQLAGWRGTDIGVVFQFFQLLPTLTVRENVLLAMDFVGLVPVRERRARANELLERVGVADQADKLPGTLSGGQQQRVAIARALANDPTLLIADEPTGNLDTDTAAAVLDLLKSLPTEGRSVIVATHDETIARSASRLIRLSDGVVTEDTAQGAKS